MSDPSKKAPPSNAEFDGGSGGSTGETSLSHTAKNIAGDSAATPELTAGEGQCRPNYDETIAFLQKYRPMGKGFWLLMAIRVDKKDTKVMSFSPSHEKETREWLERFGAENENPEHAYNLYFHVNPTSRMGTSKANKEDIAKLEYLHVDLDPRPGEDMQEEKKRFLAALTDSRPKGVPEPTFVVDSGAGYHAYWRLSDPMVIDGDASKIEEAERYNQQLEAEFGGDHCWNVDRILRLPGTVNRPDRKKRDKGRTTYLCSLVYYEDTAEYPLGKFTPAPPVQTEGVVADHLQMVDIQGAIESFNDVDKLDEWDVPQHTKIVIVQGSDPDDPMRWDSRSEALWYVTCELTRRGVPDEVILSVLENPSFKISESVLEKGRGARKYALKQINDAKKEVAAASEEFTMNEGKPHQSLRNFELGIRKLGVRLEYDEFAERATIQGLDGFGPTLDDAAVTRIWLLLEKRFGLKPGKDKLYAIVSDTARENVRHPVREYLDGLEWDGVQRIDRLFVDYFGAEDSAYMRAVGSIIMIAAVRRVRSPGCKFDEMPVLESKQGSAKSSAIAALAVCPGWFSDDLPLNAKAQVLIEQTVGKWIVEAGELKGMRKGDVESLKSCLSRGVDRARMAYGRLPVERPRQFVIFGTTNHHNYLKDNTGNRRFWPVKTETIDLTGIMADREQLWAEAAHREAAGETIRLDPGLYAAAAAEQESRHVEDPFVEVLANALNGLDDCKLRSIDAWEIVAVRTEQRSQEQNERLGTAMRNLGWERKKLRFGSGPEWAYAKGSGARRLVVDTDVQTGGPLIRLDDSMPAKEEEF